MRYGAQNEAMSLSYRYINKDINKELSKKMALIFNEDYENGHSKLC